MDENLIQSLDASDDERWVEHLARAKAHHAEWKSTWDALGKDPGANVEIEGPDGPMNPLVHAMMDATLMVQRDTYKPPALREGYDRLIAGGFSEFDALHVLARALTDELWETMHGRPYNESRYTFALRQQVTRSLGARRRPGR